MCSNSQISLVLNPFSVFLISQFSAMPLPLELVPQTTLPIWALDSCQPVFEEEKQVAIDSTDVGKYVTSARLCTFIVSSCHIFTRQLVHNCSSYLSSWWLSTSIWGKKATCNRLTICWKVCHKCQTMYLYSYSLLYFTPHLISNYSFSLSSRWLSTSVWG